MSDHAHCPECGGELVDWSDSSFGSYGKACLDCRLFVWWTGGIIGMNLPTLRATPERDRPPVVVHSKPLDQVPFPLSHRRVPAYRAAVNWQGA